MSKDFVKIAIRNLARDKFNSIINLSGLTLGITCFLIIFSKITFEQGFDQFHSDADRIYRVVRVTDGLAYLNGALEYRTGVFFPLPGEVRSQVPGVQQVTQMMYVGGETIRIIDGSREHAQKVFKEDEGIAFVEPEYFDMFDFHTTELNWQAGNPEESLREPYSLVLTQSIAKKYFGEENPLGKVIEIRDFKLTVSGIISDFPTNTDFPFELLISFSTFPKLVGDNFNNWYGLSDNFQCYVKIDEHSNATRIGNLIQSVHAQHTTAEMAKDRVFKLQALDEVHNDSRFGNYNRRTISQGTIISLISIGILLIVMACINHSNLTVAQLTSRAKSAGISKVLGSSRKRLIFQYLGETFILTLFAAVLSIFISRFAIKTYSNLFGIPADQYSIFNIYMLILLLLISVVVSAVAGFYPAMLISKSNPSQMIRNKGFREVKGNLHFNRVMVTFQFIIAQILIVSALIVFQQISYIESKDMGYDRENIITVDIPESNPTLLDQFSNELLRNAHIASLSFASTSPGNTRNFPDISRIIDNATITTITESKVVDSSYIHTFGLTLLEGRNFTSRESGNPIIVNQKLIKELHFQDESQAIGAEVNFQNDKAVIIGIVKDFNSNPIYDNIRPCVLAYDPGRYYMAGIRYQLSSDNERISGQLDDIIMSIEQSWQAAFPDQVFEYAFFDESIASYYKEEKKIASLIHLFTGIMLFICCLGIIGLIHHTANRKSKELAVRKVIGATMANVITLLLKNFMIWVALANIIAWPIAFFVMSRWLQNFAFRIDITIWPFVFAGFAALLIAVLAVITKAIQAASANPLNALKNE